MRLKKLLSLFLVVAMTVCTVQIPLFAVDGAAERNLPTFSDMPNDWSTEALQKAVENGLLSGSEGKILPNEYLTRAQLATIICHAFNAEVKGDLSGYSDVKPTDWYTDYMAKAYQMGVMVGSNGRMYPANHVTRQEVCVVMAKAFRLEPAETCMKQFIDDHKISDWAKGYVYAAVNAGYINGYNGMLDPLSCMTRAQFAAMMDNIVKKYIRMAGEYEIVPEGSVMINVPDVTLENSVIYGNLFIGDGVGDGEVILNNVTVTGRLVARGGGENSIIIRGASKVSNIIVSKVNGAVSVKVEGDADVEVIVIDDGSDDVYIEGTVGNVAIKASGITVTAKSAQVSNINIAGEGVTLIVDEGSIAEFLAVSGQAADTTVEVSGTVSTIETQAPKTSIIGSGSVGVAQVQAGADGTKVETPNTKIDVDRGVTGVTAAGGIEVTEGQTVINNAKGTGIIDTKPIGDSGGGGSSGGSVETVSKIVITTIPDAIGIYDNDAVVKVTFSTSTRGAEIYYTLDGSTPTKNSKPYSGPFEIKAPGSEGGSVTIKAIGIKYGYRSSSITTKTISFKGKETKVPVKYASTETKDLSIEVEYGTTTTDAINALPATIKVTGINDEEGIATIIWTIADYNGNSLGAYTATGTLTLPFGWEGEPDTITAVVKVVPILHELTIQGSTEVGQKLSVVGMQPEDGSYSYQWQRNGNPIQDAVENTYTLTEQDVGRRISVIVSYNGKSNTSSSTEMITKGDGTKDNPYLVATAEQLNTYVRNNPSLHYKQIEDISLSGYNWQPLPAFSGVYDGNNFTISNLTINLPGKDRVGLFSELSSGGQLMNIGLENANVTGKNKTGILVRYAKSPINDCYVKGNVSGHGNVGGLVGHLIGSTIKNCNATVTVTGSETVGGLVGQVDEGTIEGCSASGEVKDSGSGYVGGLIGNSFASNIKNCWAEGKIQGSNTVGGLIGTTDTVEMKNCYANTEVLGSENVGGLVGYSVKSNIGSCWATGDVHGSISVGGLIGKFDWGEMENCYANTKVTGSDSVGGLVGKLIGYLTTGKVMNSYAIGIVTGNSNTGGLVGSNSEDPGQVIASYYDSETTGQNDRGKGEPRTTEEMKTGTPSDTIYTKWSKDIWDFGGDDDYPVLKGVPGQ